MKNKKNALMAALLIAAAGPMAAQEVWRCGNQYSQQPCAGGAALQADDPRNADEAARAQAAVQRQAKAADELERVRRAQEAKAPPAVILPHGGEEARTARDGKEFKPVQFTAIAPRATPPDAGKSAKRKKKSAKKRSG